MGWNTPILRGRNGRAGSGTPSPPPSSTNLGMLEKTAYSYLSRDGADVAGIDYTQDFSIEILVNLTARSYIGYFNDIFRHCGYDALVNAARPGWAVHTGTNGYGNSIGWSLSFGISDGAGHACTWTGDSAVTGTTHIVMTYNSAAKTMDVYVNGASLSGYGTLTNASMSMPASINHPLCIGSHHRANCSTDPNEYYYSVSKSANSEFDINIARIWQKKLSSTEVADLSSYCVTSGRADIPGTVTGSPISGFLFTEEVGDKTGAVGTGWLKDNYGSNHLKIISTNTYTTATGNNSTLFTPSGSVSMVYPSNGSTNIPGNVKVRASGLYGSGLNMQYYIEADTVNTFDSVNKINSGWINCSGRWNPGFDPNTTYYLRCKARNGENTGVESGWSSTTSFTTRSAETFYVRPLVKVVGTYGSENGTSYANAFNGFRFQGGQGGIAASALQAQADDTKLSPGDTVWACGNFGLADIATVLEPSTQPRYQAIIGVGTASNPINIRFDHATYPGNVYRMIRYTGSYGWVDEGGGVFSTSTVFSFNRFAFDTDSSGLPDMGTTLQDSIYYKGSSGPLTSPGVYESAGRMYVRMPDDLSPGNRIWQLGGYGQFSTIESRHLNIIGGNWYGDSIQSSATPLAIASKFIKLDGCKHKYSTTTYCIHPGWGSDDWTIENCEFSFVENGVYGANSGGDASVIRCADRLTIRSCWFHHIGVATSGNWVERDSHAIGWQAGEDWVVEDNLCEYCGTAIEQWGYQYKWARGTKIRRNVVRKVTKRSVTFGSGIALTGGDLYEGRRANCELLHNVIMDTDGSGIHSSTGDTMPVKYNLILNTGLIAEGPGYDDFMWQSFYGASCPSDRPCNLDCQYNVFINPYHRATGSTGRYYRGGGNGLGTITINNNLYWDNDTTAATAGKFSFPGIGGGSTYSFTGWKALGTVDQNSFFEDPLTSSNIPAGFDDLMIKMFCRANLGDVDGSGSAPNASDLTYFDGYAAGNGPRIAARKLLQNLITYGAY